MTIITLKPHPTCVNEGDQIDIYPGDGAAGTPYTSVHVDVFWNVDDQELYDRLFKNMETITVKLVPVDEEENQS